MKKFIIVITYKDGIVENIPAYCTIEQISKAIQTYNLVPSIENVYLWQV